MLIKKTACVYSETFSGLNGQKTLSSLSICTYENKKIAFLAFFTMFRNKLNLETQCGLFLLVIIDGAVSHKR